MSVRQNKNKKFLSSLLCALLCSSNSNVSSMIVRPNLADEYNDRNGEDLDDDEYEDAPWEINIDKKTLLKWLSYGLLGLAANKKFLRSNSSITDDISSGFQELVGYNGGAELAKVLNLSYAEVAEAVSLGGKKLDAKWARDLGKLAGELDNNGGWVNTADGLSTYWKLTCSVKTDLDLEFGKNTGAVLKKLISNRSYLGTPLVVDKEMTLVGNVLVKPFTEDGGFKKDGLSTFKGDSSDYWFAGTREFLVNAENSRGSLFSVNSAMLQTYHLFYQRKMWENNRYGEFNNEGNPNVLPSDKGKSECIYEDKEPTGVGYVNKGKWAWMTKDYVYVRVPIANKDALWNTIPIWNDNPGGPTAAQKFESAITAANGLATWLGNSGDLDSKHNHCRYIAIPI